MSNMETWLDLEEDVLALWSWLRQHPCVYWLLLLGFVALVFWIWS